jgi:hypothetical protein
VLQPADQQAKSDGAVQHDLDDGPNRIAGDRRAAGCCGDCGDDERHLDDGDRQRQDQRAVGLAEPLGQMLGMPHHAECAPQDRGEQPGEQQQRQRPVTCGGGKPALAKGKKQRRGQPDRGHLAFAAQQLQHDPGLPGGFSTGLRLH